MLRLTIASLLAVAGSPPPAPAPTWTDEKYDTKHERNVLDFWQAKTDKPAPVVVWFHGGGFTQGDKKQIVDRDNVVNGLLAKGVSVASCNYPFLKDATYEQILAHCGRRSSSCARRPRSGTSTPSASGRPGPRPAR